MKDQTASSRLTQAEQRQGLVRREKNRSELTEEWMENMTLSGRETEADVLGS